MCCLFEVITILFLTILGGRRPGIETTKCLKSTCLAGRGANKV